MGKLMETAEIEVLRGEILGLCRMAEPYGAGIPVMKAALRKSGYEVDERELRTQIEYLQGKGLVRTDEVSNRRLELQRLIVHLTPEGMDYLDGNSPDIVGVG